MLTFRLRFELFFRLLTLVREKETNRGSISFNFSSIFLFWNFFFSFGIDRDFDEGLGKWFVNVFDDEEIYEKKARGDCKEKKKRLIVWRINTIYNSLFIWDWKEEL